mmetsp:Transcript_59582/g.141777  ORF Transcript_59582/g.141777 Transcript_59582/m.141777 type:complete len:304 (-) Transcript_59582:64-975(-)
MQGKCPALLACALSLALVSRGAAYAHSLRESSQGLLSPHSSLKLSDSTLTLARAQQWLVRRLPQPGPTPDYVDKNMQLAFKSSAQVHAAQTVPKDIFLRYVLPFQQLDEPVDDWRQLFAEKLLPVAQAQPTLRAVAEAVIPFAFYGAFGKNVSFMANNTPQIMAPVTQTLSKGYASCTGLSIFLSDCLRSVGVPARVVGTAEWNTQDGGNHNWVEVWLGDGWHFLDAVPSKTVYWDKAWFSAMNVSSRAVPGSIHGIYTPAVDPKDATGKYALTWRDPPIHMEAIDRTAAYSSLSHAEWDPSV